MMVETCITIKVGGEVPREMLPPGSIMPGVSSGGKEQLARGILERMLKEQRAILKVSSAAHWLGRVPSLSRAALHSSSHSSAPIREGEEESSELTFG